MSSTPRLIASRELLYSRVGEARRETMTVGITQPRLLQPGELGFDHGGAAVCAIVFDGIPVKPIEIHGADSLQALALAVDVDRWLRGIGRRHAYTFFYPDNGEPYFDQEFDMLSGQSGCE